VVRHADRATRRPLTETFAGARGDSGVWSQYRAAPRREEGEGMLYVYKNTTVVALDEFLGSGNFAVNLEHSAEWLEDTTSFPTLTDVTSAHAAEFDVDATQAALDYDEHWVRALPGDVDTIMRNAYKKAIELATAGDEPRPIETFWITGASDAFEMHVATSPRRVTVFVFNPGSEAEARHGSRAATSESWAFRAEHLDGQQVSGQGSPATAS
jgi:hypothetical protein